MTSTGSEAGIPGIRCFRGRQARGPRRKSWGILDFGKTSTRSEGILGPRAIFLPPFLYFLYRAQEIYLSVLSLGEFLRGGKSLRNITTTTNNNKHQQTPTTSKTIPMSYFYPYIGTLVEIFFSLGTCHCHDK